MLRIRNLNVFFDTVDGKFPAVREFDIDVDQSQIVSIVGESGSGKTVSMLAIMGLLASNAQYFADEISFDGIDLMSLKPHQRRKFLGANIGMIFQDSTTSLNPCYKVGEQLIELFKVHQGINYKQAKKKSIQLFEQVGIPDAVSRFNSYPHQLSGGMNQRVMIAMAIALGPKLLIADEPTTALDVTIQAQILNLLKAIRRDSNMAILLITHDMGVVAHMSDQVVTMYRGWQVEFSSNEKLFTNPRHPYSKDLLDSLPEMTIGNRLKTITSIKDVVTDGINGCIYYPYCQKSDDSCSTKIDFNKVDNQHRFRCIK